MEGMSRVKELELGVERSFAGSRLEKQVLAAAYELVMPLLRQPLAATLRERSRWIMQRQARDETTTRPIGSTALMARGA